MKHILFLLLICSTAQAQTTRVQSVTSGGILIWTAAGVDSAKRAMRNEQQAADRALSERIAALERSQVSLRPGTVDSISLINPLFLSVNNDVNALRSQIATAQKAISDLNATLAGNLTDDRVQASAIKTAQDAVNNVTAALEALKQYLKALP